MFNLPNKRTSYRYYKNMGYFWAQSQPFNNSKMLFYLLQILQLQPFFWTNFRQGAPSNPHPIPSKFNFSFSPLIKVLVAPLTIIVKIYTCSTIQLYSLHHLNNRLHCVHTLCTAETNVFIFFLFLICQNGVFLIH